MVKILEFKEFKRRLRLINEAEGDTPDAADAPAAAPPPAPAAPTPAPVPDMGGAPAATGELPPDPNAAPASPAAAGMKFVFIEDAKKKKWYGHHDEDGGTKRFTQYAIENDAALTDWLKVHGYEKDAELVKAALAGKKPMPANIYDDLKREVEDGKLGIDKGTIDIKFDSEKDLDNPSTSDVEVGFVKTSKS